MVLKNRCVTLREKDIEQFEKIRDEGENLSRFIRDCFKEGLRKKKNAKSKNK